MSYVKTVSVKVPCGLFQGPVKRCCGSSDVSHGQLARPRFEKYIRENVLDPVHAITFPPLYDLYLDPEVMGCSEPSAFKKRVHHHRMCGADICLGDLPAAVGIRKGHKRMMAPSYSHMNSMLIEPHSKNCGAIGYVQKAQNLGSQHWCSKVQTRHVDLCAKVCSCTCISCAFEWLHQKPIHLHQLADGFAIFPVSSSADDIFHSWFSNAAHPPSVRPSVLTTTT